MAELPHPWGAYLRLQTELASSDRVNDRNWGLEAGLNGIIQSSVSSAALGAEEIARAVASEARRERNRTAIRKKYLSASEPSFNPQPMLDARSSLRLIYSRVTMPEWKLLVEVGHGREYAELGPSNKLRVQVMRIRRRLEAA